MDDWFLEYLVCPRDRSPLRAMGDSRLACEQGHEYPVVDGVPVLLVGGTRQTMDLAHESLRLAAASGAEPPDPWYVQSLGLNDEERQGVLELARSGRSRIDPVVAFMVGATNGIAYDHLIGRLDEYPIPALRLPPGAGRTLLDLGCNWGRWSVAAARIGYRPVGIDPSLGAVMAARRVARELAVDARFIVGDARCLPIRSSSIDCVFSYSVLQHFSREDAAAALAEAGRVLKPGGESIIQMPTTFGVRCLYHQLRRRFREPVNFEVRYWTLPALRRLFESSIGPTRVSVDCYFGIGLQVSDRHLMPRVPRLAIGLSERLRALSRALPPLRYVADSVYLSSVRSRS